MRLIVSTVVRESIYGRQTTGYLYDVDWDSGTVAQRIPVPEPRHPESDRNPRGGARGGRGIAITPAGVVLANYDTLFTFDENWKIVDERSHPLFVGLHEIAWDGSSLWLTATLVDAILRAHPDGEVEVAWDPHSRDAAARLGLEPRRRPLNGSVDYRLPGAPTIDHCHLNCVTLRNDALVVNLGLVKPAEQGLASRVRRLGGRTARGVGNGSRRGESGRSVIAKVRGGEMTTVVALEKHSLPTHNGQFLGEDRVVLNDSTRNRLRAFAAGDSTETHSIAIPGTWLRGLAPVGEDAVVVGSAPASLTMVDLKSGKVCDRVTLSGDSNEAVHGLEVWPSAD